MDIEVVEEIVITINGADTTATIEELEELRDKINKIINRSPGDIKVDKTSNPDVVTCLTAAGRLKQLKETKLPVFMGTLHTMTETTEERELLAKVSHEVRDYLDKNSTVGDIMEAMENITTPPVLHEPRLDRALTRCIIQAVTNII